MEKNIFNNQFNFISRNFTKFISSELVRVTLMNGISTIIKMLTGLVSIKIVAAFIGPPGVALLGQLNNFSNIFLSLSTGGINAGVTKYLSEPDGSKEKFRKFISTGFWITIIFASICAIILIAGSSYFSRIITYDIKYRSIFTIFGFTIILYALNNFLISVINGFKEYKTYVTVNIIGSIIGLIFSVVLTIFYNTYGALLATVTFQSIVFLISLALVAKSQWFEYADFTSKFDKAAGKKLAHYTIMAFISAITVPVSQLIVRNFIITKRSIDEAGIWEGMNRISNIYLFVVMTSLSIYYLPKLSGLRSKSEFKHEIYNVYKLLIPFSFISIISIYLLKDLLIKILFTSEFLTMKSLFAVQLTGDFIRMCGWVLGYILIAKAKTKTYVAMELLNFCTFIIFSYYLIPKIGTIGATYSYTLTHCIYVLTMVVMFRNLLFKSRSI